MLFQYRLDYACSLPLTFAHFYAATPFPGSDFYEEAVQMGWLDTELEGVNMDECCINTELLDSVTVNRYIQKAYKTFYRRPGILMRGLFIPSGPKEFLNLLKSGYQFYRGMQG